MIRLKGEAKFLKIIKVHSVKRESYYPELSYESNWILELDGDGKKRICGAKDLDKIEEIAVPLEVEAIEPLKNFLISLNVPDAQFKSKMSEVVFQKIFRYVAPSRYPQFEYGYRKKRRKVSESV